VTGLLSMFISVTKYIEMVAVTFKLKFLIPYSQNIFFITYKWAQKARMLVPGKLFKTSVM